MNMRIRPGVLLAFTLGVVALVAIMTKRGETTVSTFPAPTPGAGGKVENVPADKLYSKRQELDLTVWSAEVEAQDYEATFTRLWDNLRSATNKYAVFDRFEFESISWGSPAGSNSVDHGIVAVNFSGEKKVRTRQQFSAWMKGMATRGFELVQSEWHHREFHPANGTNARSIISFKLHVENRTRTPLSRFIVNGELHIGWQAQRSKLGYWVTETIDVKELLVHAREGQSGFNHLMTVGTNGLPVPTTIFFDLNQDGFAELLIPSQNLVYWNRGGQKYEAGRLCNYPILEFQGKKAIETRKGNFSQLRSVVADLTGDGRADLLLAGPGYGVVLFKADDQRKFSSPPAMIMEPHAELASPTVITTGDVNGDGLLDIYLGQSTAVETVSVPYPFYDANDGEPSYLLMNQGDGSFKDETKAAGLGAKNRRRVFSASFVDLDNDRDLDLLVVSDYAGVDAYSNDGKGIFTDITKEFVTVSANFGMGHTFADFDLDGRLDFFVTGMSSTTARRLETLGLNREEFPEYREMRKQMAYGNRMYLGRGKGLYAQPVFKETVAHSGWSWGCTAFDFANDGDMDLYIGNGHISGKSCKDYCTTFWTHDIYAKDASSYYPDSLNVLMGEMGRQGDQSWNGYEKNVLFINLKGKSFVNAAFLFGIALNIDSRGIVADDFDLDGRVDLAVVERRTHPRLAYFVHLYANQYESVGNWIGVTLLEEAGTTIFGARIKVRAGGKTFVNVLVNGDSSGAQHSQTKHFGIGAVSRVDSIEIEWPNGGPGTVIRHPAINQYHRIGREGAR